MGIYFVQGLLVLAISLAGAAARAQPAKNYKNRAQFACKGAGLYNVSRATVDDYDRLDRELSYANRALLQPEKLIGIYKFDQRDEDNRIVTNTIELQLIRGKLYSRLINWGGKFTTQFEPVNIVAERAFIEISYPPASIPIQVRPVAKQKLRYAFSDSCELNFPGPYSAVFIRKE
jgi:hypothetical protein